MSQVILLRQLIYQGPPCGHLRMCLDALEAIMQIGRDENGQVTEYILHADDQDRWMDLCDQWGVVYMSEQAVNDMFDLCTAVLVGLAADSSLFPWVELVESLPEEDVERPICIYRCRDQHLDWEWLDEFVADLDSYRKPPPAGWKPIRPEQVKRRRAALKVVEFTDDRRSVCPSN